MKKTIIIFKNYRKQGKHQLSVQNTNLVFSDSVAVIDLPEAVRDIVVQRDKVVFKAVSWCMFPVIWAGDLLKIELIEPEDAMIGDIVLYKSAGRAYAHRLAKIYEEKGKLHMLTCGERGYRSHGPISSAGVSTDNILGKVIEIKRGKLTYTANEVNLGLRNLVSGKLRLLSWTTLNRMKQLIAKIFIRLQRIRQYRCFFRRLTQNKISFFGGTPVTESIKEINNFCHYQKFDDFSQDFSGSKKTYNLSARLYNKPIGNLSLILEKADNRKVCTLANFIVRVPCRGWGIGSQLLDRALYLCNKVNVDEIKVFLSEGDKISQHLFMKSGFMIMEVS